MKTKTHFIPKGYHTATPYLIVNGGAKALDFYKQAFGAKELMRMPKPDQKVGHAEIEIGTSRIMLSDEFPEMGARSPLTIGGTAVFINLYVEDVDAVFKRAIAAGAKEMSPVKDQFYGDRMGVLVDPFGHMWSIATHIEDVSIEELRKRSQDIAKYAK